VLVCRLHHRPVDIFQLRHQFKTDDAQTSETDLLRAAASLGFKARVVSADWTRLRRAPLPVIVRHRDGHYLVVVRSLADGRMLVHDPLEAKPLYMTRDTLKVVWTGQLVLFRLRRGTRPTRSGFGWFVPVLGKYRRLLGEVLVASLFVQVFALVTPLFFQVVIDKVLVHRGISTLDVLAIGLLAVALFDAVLSGLRDYLFSHTCNRVDAELGARLYRHLLSLPMAYFRARRVGDSVARVRELENLRGFVTGAALTVLMDLPFTLAFLAILYLYSPTLTAVVATTIPAYLCLSLAITPALRGRVEERFSHGAANQAFLVESVNNVETVKGLAAEPRMQQRWEQQLTQYVRASFRASHLGNIAGKSADLINKVTIVLVLWLGARLVMEGQLTVGQLVAFNMLVSRVSGPILRLVQLWQEFQQASVSVKRLADIVDTPVEQDPTAGVVPAPRMRGQLTFEAVTFRYRPESSEVVRDISFRMQPGVFVGVVGRSGSGKSTLAKLIQRLYTPERGRVLIDGVDVSQLDLAWLRRQIAVVEQDNRLFNASIRDNIAMTDPTASMERVVRVAQLAGAHEFIRRFPEGYETVVGESGATLSGGQRQRIAIARALFGEPRVLIMDEATSALDYQSEQIICHNMASICRGRTVLMIAHRLTTVQAADCILVIDNGRISERGRHQELLARDGLYAHMFALQSASSATGRVAARTGDSA
jgi:subfamily B ATP-binding cassette protein HlyB/CyaB